MAKFFKKKAKKGSTLVELIGVMIVIAIIAAIAIGGIIAARDRANVTNTQSDLRTYENAAKQVMMAYPDIMKYKDGGTVSKKVIDLLNNQLETEWKFTELTNTAGSGAVGYSTIKRDAWDMPYALYMYTDTQTTKYGNKDLNAPQYKNEDSVFYLVIASAGKNSTGVGVGTAGDNIDKAHGNIIEDQGAMINNTDGIDDMGLIVRIYNGDVYSATFGFEGATLGTLEGLYCVFGATTSDDYGIYYDQAAGKTATTFAATGNYATSLEAFKTESMIKNSSSVTPNPNTPDWMGNITFPASS